MIIKQTRISSNPGNNTTGKKYASDRANIIV